MNEAVIRPYREADIEAMLEAWYEASLLAHPFLPAEFLADEAIRIRDVFLPRSQAWVYEVDGRVWGFISLLGNEVGGLFVHPARQRQGIGHALMDQAVSLRGTIELDVFAANPLGRAFYAAYGFVEVDRYVDEEIGQLLIRLRYDVHQQKNLSG